MKIKSLFKTNNYRYFFLSLIRLNNVGLREYLKEGVQYYRKYTELTKLLSGNNGITIAFRLYLIYNYCKVAYIHNQKSNEFVLSYVPSKVQNLYFHEVNTIEDKMLTFDKIKFYNILSKNKLPFPKIIFYNENGVNYNWSYQQIKITNKLLLNEFPIFSKPIRDNGGVGINRFENYEELIIRDNCLYQEYVYNHSEIIKIGGSKALNTVRIITYINKEGNMEVLSAIIRLSKDEIVDNWGKGSINVQVQSDTGKLGEIGITKYNEHYFQHPDGSVKFDGFQLPMWTELIAILKKSVEAFRSLKFIAWDIGISPEGPVIVEANAGCDLFHAQLFEPYLQKSIITDFADIDSLLIKSTINPD